MPWPSNWMGTLGVQNVIANWTVLSGGQLQTFAYQARLSMGDLLCYSALLVVAGLVGSLLPLHHRRWLAVLFLPAWLNLFSVLVVDPRVSGARLWYDFFRHISYPLPLTTLAAVVAVEALLGTVRDRLLKGTGHAALNILLLLVVLWNVNLLSKPNLSFGEGAGNLIGGGGGRLHLIDIVQHPIDLPVFSLETVDGYHVVTAWRNTLWGYPDYLGDFFAGFDAIRATTGTAYQTGSLFLYLAALVMATLPACLRARTTDLARRASRLWSPR